MGHSSTEVGMNRWMKKQHVRHIKKLNKKLDMCGLKTTTTLGSGKQEGSDRDNVSL